MCRSEQQESLLLLFVHVSSGTGRPTLARMADRPDQPDQDLLVAISFPDQFRASEFMTAAARLVSQGKLKAKDAVFITKGDDGKAHVRETKDLQTGTAA